MRLFMCTRLRPRRRAHIGGAEDPVSFCGMIRRVYEALLAVHVVLAVIGFGATFSYPVIQLVAERRAPSALPLAVDTILAISRFVAVPATVAVGLTGAYLVGTGPYRLSDAWLSTSLALYIVVMAVATVYLAPAYGRLRDEAGHGTSSGYRALSRRIAVVGTLEVGAVVAIVVLMVVKPG